MYTIDYIMEASPADLGTEESFLSRIGLKRRRITRLLWSFGVFLITSIVLFIIFGVPSAFVAGYIHGVLYNHRKKTKEELARMNE